MHDCACEKSVALTSSLKHFVEFGFIEKLWVSSLDRLLQKTGADSSYMHGCRIEGGFYSGLAPSSSTKASHAGCMSSAGHELLKYIRTHILRIPTYQLNGDLFSTLNVGPCAGVRQHLRSHSWLVCNKVRSEWLGRQKKIKIDF